MANPGDQQQNYWNPNVAGDANYFQLPLQENFGEDLTFQSFDNNATAEAYTNQSVYQANPYLDPNVGNYGANVFTPTSKGFDSGQGDFEDEPPLLEELGINLNFIIQKTLTVLNPFRTPDPEAAVDTDFAGPMVFCLAFGGFLLLSGKVHFNYIYGLGVLGCLSVWALLSLMSNAQVALGTVITVLGYCILPMVALSGINVVFNLQGYIGTVLTALSILWCSLSASKLFVTALTMEHQQPLILYPCALFYGVFALITIF